MKRLAPVFALLLLPALRAPAAAQVPYVGLAVGTSHLPGALAECRSGLGGTGEVRVGLSFGSLSVEGRASALVAGTDDCIMALPTETFLPGRHTSVEHPFERAQEHTAAELRVRFDAPSALPFTLSAGAGWIAPHGLPFVAGSIGLRTRGRVRLVAEVDQAWYRAPFDRVTRDYDQDGVGGPALSSRRGHDWHRGSGLRIGAEVPLR